MNSHVLRFAFFAFLFAFATSAHAQATGGDCSTTSQPTKTWNEQPPNGPNCNGNRDQAFTVYSSTVITCTNNNTGQVYDQELRQTTGTGWYSTTGLSGFCSSPVTEKCNPNITQEMDHATSGSDYNRFYLRAWDAIKTYHGTTPCAVTTDMSRQDFAQCQGVACQSSCPYPPGGPPYGGNGVCYAWDTSSCTWIQTTCNNSPILVDVSGNGFQLTSSAGGVSYDISGNGVPVQMAWTAAGAQNAFLCLPDANGNCDSGKQLFGNFTPQPKSATPNGFAALAVYDAPASGGNGDGVIDARDAIFSSLRLWIDANHDGLSQPNELFTLPALGITSISLNYKWDQRTDQYGNVFRYRSQVGSTDGAGRMAYDVFFVSQPSGTKAALKACPPRPFITPKEEKTLLR